MDITMESIQLREEYDLFYSEPYEKKELGCIGHLRGDFGSNGKGFYTSWFPHACDEKNDEAFKAVFDRLIGELRAKGKVLENRASMYNFCAKRKDCNLSTHFSDLTWGFRILTQDYAIYLRCTPILGDYNFYAYCYDKETLFHTLAKQRGLPRYCYTHIRTTHENVRIDFAEHGYVPYQQGGTLEEVKKLNEEIGVTPAQKAAMEVGSMFSWNAIGADPKQYNEHGFPVKKKEEREER